MENKFQKRQKIVGFRFSFLHQNGMLCFVHGQDMKSKERGAVFEDLDLPEKPRARRSRYTFSNQLGFVQEKTHEEKRIPVSHATQSRLSSVSLFHFWRKQRTKFLSNHRPYVQPLI